MEQERGRLLLMRPSLQKRDLPTRPSVRKVVGPMPKGPFSASWPKRRKGIKCRKDLYGTRHPLRRRRRGADGSRPGFGSARRRCGPAYIAGTALAAYVSSLTSLSLRSEVLEPRPERLKVRAEARLKR